MTPSYNARITDDSIQLLSRQFSCGCSYCLGGSYGSCCNVIVVGSPRKEEYAIIPVLQNTTNIASTENARYASGIVYYLNI